MFQRSFTGLYKLTPGPVYFVGLLSLPASPSLGDYSSFAPLSQYWISTGNSRTGNLHYRALLIRGLYCITYRTNLSKGPRGSGYRLEVLICIPFRLTNDLKG